MDKLAELEKELLADMEENPVEYKETVSNVFEIDSNLRTINIPVTVKNIGVESDDDVKRLEFTMPKQYGEFDLSQFRIRINYANANGDKSIYLVEDKKVSGDNITFSWLVGRNVTKYKGQVNFIICLKLSDEKGKILKELNTTLCRLEVLEGLEVVPVVDEETIDTIEQLLNIVEKRTTEAVKQVQAEGTKQTKSVTAEGIKQTENITAEGTKQVQAVQNAAQEIIADREQIQENKTAITALTQSKADGIINTATGEHIAVGDSSGHLLDNLKIYGKSVQNGTPTPDNPVPIVSTGDEENIEIEVTGKNLIPFPYPMLGGVGTTKTLYGVTATVLEDRGIRITGTASDMVYINIVEDAGLIKDGLIYSIDLRNGKPNNNLIFYFVSKGTTVNKVYYPQIEYGEKATDYEPFQPLQSLSIPTANGLLGIPTESGGNYTDQKGQQWICDSIDLGRGKYVHRVKKLVLNGSENFIFDKINDYGIANFFIKLPIKSKARKSFCSHLPNKDISIANATDEGFTIVINEGIFLRFNSTRINTVEALKAWLKENPVTIIYMNEPQTESDIPAEVFEAYKKLYSNYPSTVIQNYSGTDMELSYVADTKNYTDNKIKEAVFAQTQNLANLLSLMPLSTQAAMIEADTNNILDNMEVTEHE